MFFDNFYWKGWFSVKFYAVKIGRAIGIFESWNECKKSVEGYPGAEFKSFCSREEAESFLKSENIWKHRISEDIKAGYLIAFTDGSYDEKQQKCSCGVLIIDKDGNNHELCMTNSNQKYLPYRNVTGEIFGVINAMDWAISNGYQKIKIYHDYEGLSKWISGEWKAKTPVSCFGNVCQTVCGKV